jgi:ribosomal protein L37AE/L43A
MAFCKICSKEFSNKRKKIGYDTCLNCGDKVAHAEAIRKSKCVAPLFNKGAYQYIGSIEDAKYLGR